MNHYAETHDFLKQTYPNLSDAELAGLDMRIIYILSQYNKRSALGDNLRRMFQFPFDSTLSQKVELVSKAVHVPHVPMKRIAEVTTSVGEMCATTAEFMQKQARIHKLKLQRKKSASFAELGRLFKTATELIQEFNETDLDNQKMVILYCDGHMAMPIALPDATVSPDDVADASKTSLDVFINWRIAEMVNIAAVFNYAAEIMQALHEHWVKISLEFLASAAVQNLGYTKDESGLFAIN